MEDVGGWRDDGQACASFTHILCGQLALCQVLPRGVEDRPQCPPSDRRRLQLGHIEGEPRADCTGSRAENHPRLHPWDPGERAEVDAGWVSIQVLDCTESTAASPHISCFNPHAGSPVSRNGVFPSCWSYREEPPIDHKHQTPLRGALELGMLGGCHFLSSECISCFSECPSSVTFAQAWSLFPSRPYALKTRCHQP